MEVPTASLSDTPVISGVYTPLGPTEIRLVEILPGAFDDPIDINISVVDLENNPVYDALSYVWYPRDGTVDTEKPLELAIVINHESSLIPLGANLEAAIRYLRLHQQRSEDTKSGRMLWIDALCINQHLSLERNHQVGLMKSIYSSAKQVLIWLGPPQHDSNRVVSVMRTGHLDTSQLAGALYYSEPLNLNGFLDNLELLLRRHWFGRVWELTLACRDPIVHVGYETIEWKQFTHAVHTIQARLRGKEETTGSFDFLQGPATAKLESSDTIVYIPALIARAEVVRDLADMRLSGPNAPFHEQFFRTMHLQSTDPRDKVFGLLGVSKFRRDTIAPDYTKSMHHISALATATILRDGLPSYVAYQLWQTGNLSSVNWGSQSAEKARPSWRLGLESMYQVRRTNLITETQQSTIEQALMRSRSIAPIADISADLSNLSTAGVLLGKVMAADVAVVRKPHRYLPALCKFMRHLDRSVAARKIMSAVLGPHHPRASNHGDLLPDLETILLRRPMVAPNITSPAQNEPTEQLPTTRFETAMLETYSHAGCVFVTDKGYVGLRYWLNHPNLEEQPLVLIGLFGINLPFLLGPVGEGKYKIDGIVHVADHKLGDENIEALGPDGNWRDLVKEGKLEMFTIV